MRLQPENSIILWHRSGGYVEVEVFDAINSIPLSSGDSQRQALRLAIKRLERLKRDCERELEKCDE